MNESLVAVDHVSRTFVKSPGWAESVANHLGGNYRETVVHALDDVTLDIQRGEVLGIVGESGCGKSTLGRIVTGLLPASAGTVRFSPHGRNAKLARQMIFQDPSASLNPRLRVVDQIGEAAVAHGLVGRREVRDYVANLLGQVGLDASVMARFPHQFSGGQRARIGIARALAVKPELLVCDESVAALDVSIQAQVLNLFAELRRALGLTYVFISHDLGVVQHLSTRVAVMYLGRVVEIGPTPTIFASPQHPYTRALLEAMPRIRTGHQRFAVIKGEVASPIDPPSGCHFHPRCPRADARCVAVAPPVVVRFDAQVACHYA